MQQQPHRRQTDPVAISLLMYQIKINTIKYINALREQRARAYHHQVP